MTLVRYRTGLVLKGMYCSFCDARRTGKVFQEGARWMARLSCGHLSFKGWVSDPDDMEKRGLVNAKADEDPRAISLRKQQEEERLMRAKENLEREMRRAGYSLGEIRSAQASMDREFAKAEVRRI